MNIKFLTSMGVLLTLLSVSAHACDATIKSPCIVLDTVQGEPAAPHFRSGADFNMPDWWVSGSAAPSEMGWMEVKNKIAELSHGKAKVIVDLDLRQEPHLFLNGDGITLSIQRDWISVGKTHKEAVKAEQDWETALASSPSVPSVITGDEFKDGGYNLGVTIPITRLDNEAKIVRSLGFRYERLTITNHMHPDPATVDQLLYFLDHLPKNTWIHMHCRAGNGRTTTVMAMLDMLKNAGKDSFDEIVSRQASVYPYYDLREIKQDDPVSIPYYEARLAFMKSFYEYAKARSEGMHSTWQGWLKREKTAL